MFVRLRSIYLILNLKSLAIVAIALVSTYVCKQLGLKADFPMAVVMTAVVFPIVFSISAAYTRRETALAEYAAMKAHGQAIYLANARLVAGPQRRSTRVRAEDHGKACFRVRADLLMAPPGHLRVTEKRVYDGFSDLSLFVRNNLRHNGLPSGECSRTNQYVSKMLISFETIKHIYEYRTPISLRAFSDFFLMILPVLYGPYFAHLGGDYLFGLVYVPPVLFSLVLVTLDNIQDHLENPFDQVGEDDIVMDVEAYVSRMTV